MTALPEEALQKLICSACKKYLSVFPIKVYPNKNVKCGRCCDSKEDDGGTVSRLYEEIAKQVEFPCINRFEGCKEVLSPNEMEKHEDTCYSDDYQCPLCDNFNGPSFDLLNHMKINHKNAAIENKEFLIELQDGLRSDVYFYCQNSFFAIVKYQYDSSNQEIMLFMDVIGKHRVGRKNVEYTFLLYSIHNKLQYKSGLMKSPESGLDHEKSLKVDIAMQRYPKNILMCKFQLRDPVVTLNKYRFEKKQPQKQPPQNHVVQREPPILDKSVNKATLIFKFDGLTKFTIDKEIKSDCKYWVGDRCWWLNLYKKKEIDTKEYMSLYLNQDKPKKCKIDVLVTLRSFVSQNLNYRLHLVRKSIGKGRGWPKFIGWDNLMDPTRGYLNNDSIEIHVRLEVLPHEVVKCTECQELCPTCAS